MSLKTKRTLIIVAVAAGTLVAGLVAAGPVRQWWSSRNVEQSIAPAGGEHAGHGSPAATPPPDEHAGMAATNMVEISPEKLQSVGVRFEPAERRSLEREIRTVGRAEIDERRLARVNVKIDGWIETLNVNYTGQRVDRGQLLFSLYSPELLATQREYLLALKAKNMLKNNPSPRVVEDSFSLLESARQRLRLWDIPDAQIDELERTGQPSRTVAFYSPIGGIVIERKVLAGARVSPGDEIYTIADLSQIWIVADIYEYELPFIQVGQRAVLTLSYDPGRVLNGRAAFIYPTLDPETRTAKVRFEAPNPGESIKPGMYANVELKIPLGRRLAVPRDAVLESGERQIIFINHGEGKLEWRNAKLGVQAGDWVEILEGLKEGEQIVTSANFLIDSESQLKTAVGGMRGMTH